MSPAPSIFHVKSDNDETWQRHTMRGNLFKLVKKFDYIFVIPRTSSSFYVLSWGKNNQFPEIVRKQFSNCF